VVGARRIGAGWEGRRPLNKEEVAAWRLWMREVFMPVNEEIVGVVTHNADLLIESEMPQCLLDACAHVAAYRPVMKEWERGEPTDNREVANTSVINFPAEALFRYASISFKRLKAEQNSLLGEGTGGTG
jgi:Fe-S cluster biosynthesis and repair protein YggX